jgi:hypothetical protein
MRKVSRLELFYDRKKRKNIPKYKILILRGPSLAFTHT